NQQGDDREKFERPTEAAGQIYGAIQTVRDTTTPFVPLFNSDANILAQMLSIYENAKCNEKICATLLERVEIAQTAVKSLQRKYQANEKNLEIKIIIMLGCAVKDAFEKILKNLKNFVAINLTIAIYNAEQRAMEAKNVAEDLDILKKSMSDMKDELLKL
ncbi:21047_t:CDS:2, partial [Gigaspora rosea]